MLDAVRNRPHSGAFEGIRCPGITLGVVPGPLRAKGWRYNNAVAVTPDGKRAVSGSNDGT